jgi:hypothetical protein
MSLISFLILNNLKSIRDSDENSESLKRRKTGLLKKVAKRVAKSILRLEGAKNGNKNNTNENQ